MSNTQELSEEFIAATQQRLQDTLLERKTRVERAFTPENDSHAAKIKGINTIISTIETAGIDVKLYITDNSRTDPFEHRDCFHLQIVDSQGVTSGEHKITIAPHSITGPSASYLSKNGSTTGTGTINLSDSQEIESFITKITQEYIQAVQSTPEEVQSHIATCNY